MKLFVAILKRNDRRQPWGIEYRPKLAIDEHGGCTIDSVQWDDINLDERWVRLFPIGFPKHSIYGDMHQRWAVIFLVCQEKYPGATCIQSTAPAMERLLGNNPHGTQKIIGWDEATEGDEWETTDEESEGEDP